MCCIREVRLRVDLGVEWLNEASMRRIAKEVLATLAKLYGMRQQGEGADASYYAGSPNCLGSLFSRARGEFVVERYGSYGISVRGAQPLAEVIAKDFRTLYQAYALQLALQLQGFASQQIPYQGGGSEMTVMVEGQRGNDKIVVVLQGDGKALWDARGCAGGGSLNDVLLAAMTAFGVQAEQISVLQHEGHDGGGVVDSEMAHHLAHVHG